jgi:hypothetical protein
LQVIYNRFVWKLQFPNKSVEIIWELTKIQVGFLEVLSKYISKEENNAGQTCYNTDHL